MKRALLLLAALAAFAGFGYTPVAYTNSFTRDGVTYVQRGALGTSDYVATNIDSSAVGKVQSVNGKTGDVVLAAKDVGAVPTNVTEEVKVHLSEKLELLPNNSTNGIRLSVSGTSITASIDTNVNVVGLTPETVGALPDDYDKLTNSASFKSAVEEVSPPTVLPDKWALANVTNSSGGVVSAEDVSARPSSWTPTAQEVGAVPTNQTKVIIGSSAQASGNYSTAVGRSAKANGSNASAYGDSATASGNYSTSIGKNSGAGGNYGTSLGYNAKATGGGSIAIGYNATASQANSVHIGGSDLDIDEIYFGTLNLKDDLDARQFELSDGSNGYVDFNLDIGYKYDIPVDKHWDCTSAVYGRFNWVNDERYESANRSNLAIFISPDDYYWHRSLNGSITYMVTESGDYATIEDTRMRDAGGNWYTFVHVPAHKGKVSTNRLATVSDKFTKIYGAEKSDYIDGDLGVYHIDPIVSVWTNSSDTFVQETPTLWRSSLDEHYTIQWKSGIRGWFMYYNTAISAQCPGTSNDTVIALWNGSVEHVFGRKYLESTWQKIDMLATTNQLVNLVPNTRTINGQPLTNDLEISGMDYEAMTNTVNAVKEKFYDQPLQVEWTVRMVNGDMKLYATTNVNTSVLNN